MKPGALVRLVFSVKPQQTLVGSRRASGQNMEGCAMAGQGKKGSKKGTAVGCEGQESAATTRLDDAISTQALSLLSEQTHPIT